MQLPTICRVPNPPAESFHIGVQVEEVNVMKRITKNKYQEKEDNLPKISTPVDTSTK